MRPGDDDCLTPALAQLREAADFDRKGDVDGNAGDPGSSSVAPFSRRCPTAACTTRKTRRPDGDRSGDAAEITIEDAVTGEALGQSGKRESGSDYRQ
jgi:hypothetical protein